MPPTDAAEPHFERAVTSAARLAGLGAGLIAAVAGRAIDTPLLVLLGVLGMLGALTARASRTYVVRGAVIQEFTAAPLRPGEVRTIASDRIRGIEVLHAHDSDAMPGRADQYWVALRLTDRRSGVSLGGRHYTPGPAEVQAAALRTALGRGQPAALIELRLPAELHERLTLLAGAGIAALATWAALDSAGGRPMEDVWPLAALSLVGGMGAFALLAAAAITGGTIGEVRPATGHVTLRRGVGWLGSRSNCLRFEEIRAVTFDGEQLDGNGVVVLTLDDGTFVPVHRGSGARDVADRVGRLVAADRR